VGFKRERIIHTKTMRFNKSTGKISKEGKKDIQACESSLSRDHEMAAELFLQTLMKSLCQGRGRLAESSELEMGPERGK
jgi:hypothetical protein